MESIEEYKTVFLPNNMKFSLENRKSVKSNT